MKKITEAGIGAAVLLVGAAALFGIRSYENKTAEEALAPQEVSTEAYYAPDASDIIYEAGTAIMPGMEPGGAYLSNYGLIVNGDGTVTYEGATYKRSTYMKAVLLLGIDKKRSVLEEDPDGDTGASDGILLIAQDTSRNEIKVFQIPRDSMLTIERIDQNGNKVMVFDHLSLAFTDGEGRDESAKASVRAVSDLLCGLSIDHYMVASLSILADVNDLAGGVTVTVPNGELVKANPDWTEGKQIMLHGDEAERFLRYRDITIDGTPVTRLSQHKAYIKGFYEAVRKDSYSIAEICDYLEGKVVSDMTKGEYEKLALDAVTSKFNPEADITVFPGEATMGEEDGVIYDQYYVDYAETIPIILDTFYRKVD